MGGTYNIFFFMCVRVTLPSHILPSFLPSLQSFLFHICYLVVDILFIPPHTSTAFWIIFFFRLQTYGKNRTTSSNIPLILNRTNRTMYNMRMYYVWLRIAREWLCVCVCVDVCVWGGFWNKFNRELNRNFNRRMIVDGSGNRISVREAYVMYEGWRGRRLKSLSAYILLTSIIFKHSE